MDSSELFELLMDASSPGIQPGLARLSMLCRCLGHPERSFRAVHVTGTNGKGSTAACLSSIFREAGYHCALYTSPHLEDLTERLRVGGESLPTDAWMCSARAVLSALAAEPGLQAEPPTFFELLTATVFHLLRERDVPYVILEAGMGGRLDATNILPPDGVLLSVVTPVAMDHGEFLGGTLSAVAGEKFAVVRPGRPALFSGEPPEVIPQFRASCARVGAEAHVFSEEWSLGRERLNMEGASFAISGRGEELEIRTPLLGRHQTRNASLAAAACQLLREKLPHLSRDAIIRGIAKTRWPGRLELLPGVPPVLLDGGHNPHAVSRVVASLREILPQGARVALVYATMRDKDFGRSLVLLRGLADGIFCTQIPGNPRSLPAQALSEAATEAGFFRARALDDPLEAVNQAGKGADVVLCLGSLYLVGWLRQRLRRGEPF